MTLRYLVLIFCVYAGIATHGSEFDRLPLWPGTEQLPKELANKNVFRDLMTMEVVISFPADRDGSSGKRTTYRYRPQNQVDPHIDVDMISRTDGRIQYLYGVTNGAKGREPIDVWTLVGPSSDHSQDLQIDHLRWGKVHMKGTNTKQAAFPEAPSGDALMFSSHTAQGLDIPAGKRTRGFTVSSSCLPGITTAYVQGGKPLMTNGDLPSFVMDQLRPIMRLEESRKLVLTIGPRFPPNTPRNVIARDYLLGVQRMIERRDLQENEFTLGFAKSIESCRNGTGSCTDLSHLNKLAATPLEKQLTAAVSFSLTHEPSR